MLIKFVIRFSILVGVACKRIEKMWQNWKIVSQKAGSLRKIHHFPFVKPYELHVSNKKTTHKKNHCSSKKTTRKKKNHSSSKKTTPLQKRPIVLQKDDSPYKKAIPPQNEDSSQKDYPKIGNSSRNKTTLA